MTIYQIRCALAYGGNGPITAFELLARGLEMVEQQECSADDMAEALSDEMMARGMWREGHVEIPIA